MCVRERDVEEEEDLKQEENVLKEEEDHLQTGEQRHSDMEKEWRIFTQ